LGKKISLSEGESSAPPGESGGTLNWPESDEPDIGFPPDGDRGQGVASR